MAKHPGPLALHWAVFYPLGYVMAALPPDSVSSALDGLRQAGFEGRAVSTFTAEEALDFHRQVTHHHGLWNRLKETLSPGDEERAQDDYLELAERGMDFALVESGDTDTAERIRDVLVKHAAQEVRYYGKYIFAQLS